MAEESKKSGPVVYTLKKAVTAHAWNATRDMCAVVHNSKDVTIYSNCTAKASEWVAAYTLTKHDQLVSGVDWSDAHNKIVTCSHDRNAFVYTFDPDTDTWVPGLVVLRLPRGATGCAWSPNGDKIVVTSAYKEVRVCTFDPEQDWWWCHDDIKKADKSTVLTAAWHPNSQLLATGSAKKLCRLFSAYVEDTDDMHDKGPFAEGEDFGVNIVDFPTDGWVEGVAWSPSGFQLAFTAHDASLYIVTFAEDGVGAPSIQKILLKCAPHTELLFLTDSALVAAGHAMAPMLYTCADGEWHFAEVVDKKTVKKAAASTNSIAAARSIFAARTQLGKGASSSGDDKPKTKHSCSINSLRPYASNAAGVTRFSSSCAGGKIVVWDVSTLETDMAALSLA